MSDRQFHVADAMAQVARTLEAPMGFAETLAEITNIVRDAVPGVMAAGISVTRRGGEIMTLAATDELVDRVDEIQYKYGEGPCVDALKTHNQVVIDDMTTEDRWPYFAPRAADQGVRSQMAFRLYAEGGTLGSLNLYSSAPFAFDDEACHIASLFATHAAMAMGAARTEEHMQKSVDSRTVIGQAMGMLMQRYGLDRNGAFQFLVRLSQASQSKLRDVAERLVAEKESAGQKEATKRK